MARTQIVPTHASEPQVRILGNSVKFLAASIVAALGTLCTLGYDNEKGKETIYVTPAKSGDPNTFKVNENKGTASVNISAIKEGYGITDMSLVSNQVVEENGEFAVRIKLEKGKRGGNRKSSATA